MLSEHDRAREYTRGLRDAAERLRAGDATAAAEVIENARGYAILLREHISKEDNVLFPMASQVIPLSEQTNVAADMARIAHGEGEEGVHERFLALVERLEQQFKK